MDKAGKQQEQVEEQDPAHHPFAVSEDLCPLLGHCGIHVDVFQSYKQCHLPEHQGTD